MITIVFSSWCGQKDQDRRESIVLHERIVLSDAVHQTFTPVAIDVRQFATHIEQRIGDKIVLFWGHYDMTFLEAVDDFERRKGILEARS